MEALGSPTAAAGTKQRKSNQTGIIAYAETEEYPNSESTVVTFDNQSVAEYFYNGDLWVSFDGAQVVQQKRVCGEISVSWLLPLDRWL
jgi:chitinase